MQEFVNSLMNLEEAYSYFNWVSLVFMLEALVILWLGKLVNDLTTSYSVDDQLTKADNKALAVSYTGYIVGQAIIVIAVMHGESSDWVQGLLAVAVWSFVGILLLNLARVINDKVILRKFSGTKEIIDDKNVGVGAVQAGAYIGTAFIVAGIVSAEGGDDWKVSALGTVVFFIVGQLGFVIFSLIYEKITKYSIHEEMERDNYAAGVSFGLTLAAVGVILSKTVHESASIPAFAAWFITGLALILIARFLVDKLLLPSHKLDEEISGDQNWGVALVEGGSAVMVAFLLNVSFS